MLLVYMVEIFIEILKNYWQPILATFLFILSFILQLIKKKPVSEIFSSICDYAIDGILAAENTGASGEEKLIIAIRYVNEALLKKYPGIKTSDYYRSIVATIEDILATPQKKEK